MSTKLADYWEMLTTADKELLMVGLKAYDPQRYHNIHMGSLILVDLKTIRLVVRKITHHPYGNNFRIGRIWVELPEDAHKRKMVSTKKSLRRHLSVELLYRHQQWQQRTFKTAKKRERWEQRALRKSAAR